MAIRPYNQSLRAKTESMAGLPDEEIDLIDAKSVWLPDGELEKFLDARAAFARAGYAIRRSEMLEIQPIWLFLLIREEPAPIRDVGGLKHHIRDIMWEARVYFQDSDAMIQLCGDQITVSFLWSTPASGYDRDAAWSEFRLQRLLNALP